MVLGASIVKAFFIIILTWGVSACITPPDSSVVDALDEITVLGSTLSIFEKDNQCFLVHGHHQYSLRPKPPCYFLRKPNNTDQALFFAYADVNVDAALIITGTPVSKEERSQRNLPEPMVCGKQSQGVLIEGATVSLSDKLLDVMLCRDYGGDEKIFWHIAH